MGQSTDNANIRDRESEIYFILGGLDGLSGSIHEDADHYRQRARELAERIRRVWVIK